MNGLHRCVNTLCITHHKLAGRNKYPMQIFNIVRQRTGKNYCFFGLQFQLRIRTATFVKYPLVRNQEQIRTAL